jgi:hypothetical protein
MVSSAHSGVRYRKVSGKKEGNKKVRGIDEQNRTEGRRDGRCDAYYTNATPTKADRSDGQLLVLRVSRRLVNNDLIIAKHVQQCRLHGAKERMGSVSVVC